MGKRLGLVVIGALLLTGCASGEPEAAPGSSATETVSETAEAQAQSRSIEVSDATSDPEPSESVDEEARYLEFIKRAWRTELPSDEDLLTAASIACEEMRAGKAAFELAVITGGTAENDAWHSSQVGAIASSTICPDAVPPL